MGNMRLEEKVDRPSFKLRLSVEDTKVVVDECFDRSFCESLRSRGLIIDGFLEVLEAAYLVAKCIISIGSECGWVVSLDLISRVSPGDMDLFFVYYDLRKRGRIVTRGFRPGTLIMRKGSKGRPVEILVLREGVLVELEDIVEWSRLASGDGMDPVVAIVDGHGNVTYYEARAVRSFT